MAAAATTIRVRTDGADGVTGERRCIVTREPRDRDALVRFVVAPDGAVVPDLAETLPGRGLWLTARRDIVAAACKKGAFARAARRPVSAPADLADAVEQQLANRCVDLLALARRAGLVAAGRHEVTQRVRAGDVALLFSAADSDGRDGRELARRAGDGDRVAILTGAELGRALGRDHIVHVALAAGGLTDRLRRECRRLAGFRDDGASVDTEAQRPDGSFEES